MLKLHDIKNLETIPDYSIYYLFAIIVFTLFIIILISILIYKYLKKDLDLKKVYYKELKNLDLSSTKNSAYLITKYAKPLLKDERDKKLYEELNSLLNEYKYKKDVKSFNKEFENKFEQFLEAIHV